MMRLLLIAVLLVFTGVTSIAQEVKGELTIHLVRMTPSAWDEVSFTAPLSQPWTSVTVSASKVGRELKTLSLSVESFQTRLEVPPELLARVDDAHLSTFHLMHEAIPEKERPTFQLTFDYGDGAYASRCGEGFSTPLFHRAEFYFSVNNGIELERYDFCGNHIE